MIVVTKKQMEQLVEELKGAKEIALDTEYVPYGYPDTHLVGISLSTNGESGYYIPVGHLEGMQLDIGYVVDQLKPILEDQEKVLVCHNIQAEIKALWLQGIYLHDSEYFNQIMKPFKPEIKSYFEEPNTNIPQIDFDKRDSVKYSPAVEETHLWDTMVASWLLDTDRPEGQGLDALAKKYLGVKPVEIRDIAEMEFCPRLGPKPSKHTKVLRMDKVDIELAGKYAIEDAMYTYRLYKLFKPEIKEVGLEKVFKELEMHSVKVLTEMEILGSPMDQELLYRYGEKIKEAMERAEQEVYDCRPSKEPFNVGSTQQLNQVMFEELGIEPIGEKGKSGDYSLKKENMDEYYWRYKDGTDPNCKLVASVLEYREVSKLYGTYIEGMGAKYKADQRVHGDFRRTGARTGRISSSNPNLQNLPNNRTYPIRECFYAPTREYVQGTGMKDLYGFDWHWNTQDYSQVELRVLAHLSKDENMMDVFNHGGDIHSTTAKGCFHIDLPVEEIPEKMPELRNRAKPVNFGVVYGITGRSLARDINGSLEDRSEFFTTEEADTLIRNFLKTYPRVNSYIKYLHQKAERDGYVNTVTGRRRHLPDAQLNPRNFKSSWARRNAFFKKSKAERRSQNSPVQGSAADIIAIAMRNIRRHFMEHGGWFTTIQMILQVHDELCFLLRDGYQEEYQKVIVDKMENCVKLDVPLKVDGSMGSNWWEAG